MQKKLTITIDEEVYEGLLRSSARAISVVSSRTLSGRTAARD